jgi:hypothetical protein
VPDASPLVQHESAETQGSGLCRLICRLICRSLFDEDLFVPLSFARWQVLILESSEHRGPEGAMMKRLVDELPMQRR